MDILPSDCIIEILSYLDIKEIICFSLTSKRYLQYIDTDSYIWWEKIRRFRPKCISFIDFFKPSYYERLAHQNDLSPKDRYLKMLILELLDDAGSIIDLVGNTISTTRLMAYLNTLTRSHLTSQRQT